MNQIYSLNLNEILAFNEKKESISYQKLSIAFIRNITIDNLIPYLNFLGLSNETSFDLYMGGYDTAMKEALEKESSLYKHKPEYILIFHHLKNISPLLSEKYATLSSKQIAEEKSNVISYFKQQVHAMRENSSAKIIIKSLELPIYPSYGVYDYQQSENQSSIINEINQELIALANSTPNCFILDSNIILRQCGEEKYYDYRFWFWGKAPYAPLALKKMSLEIWTLIQALSGKTKKCLVVDCDNTLWGGIIGEDGIEKIKIGNNFPGNTYLDLQQQILNLYHKGVILCINSKNNENDVLEVLDNHPDMLLRKKHFALIYANWNNKAENLQAIANDLNIGINSLVFLDDSDFECNFIRTQLPQVEVIQVPKEKYKMANLLSSCRLFDSLQYSNTDKTRPELYRIDAQRKNHTSNFTSIEEYYISLEMVMEISNANKFTIPRIAQLTQRTNQFNLTTKRYSEDDINKILQSSANGVFCFSLKDKFGDLGIVGAVILKSADSNTIEVDSFLMSCRVIGRNAEHVFLSTILKKHLSNGIKVKSQYIRTAKNDLVSNLYNELGFSQTNETEESKNYEIANYDSLKFSDEYFKEIIFIDE